MPKRHVVFLCVLAAANGATASLILPILPDLMALMGAKTTSDAARLGGIVVFEFAAMQIAVAPISGELADTIGRRPVLIAALLLTAISHGLVVLADDLTTLILARLIGGLGAATGIAVFSMIVDIAPAQDRARLFGLVAAAGGTGAIAGPAFGGLLGAFGPKTPFVFAAIAQVTLLIFALLGTTETLSSDNRRAFQVKRLHPLAGVASIRESTYPCLFVTLSLASLGFGALPILWPYFIGLRYGWGPEMVGVSLAVAAGASIFGQTLLLPLAQRYLCDRLIVAITLTLGTALMLVLGTTNSAGLALVSVTLVSASGIGLSIHMGFLSSAVLSTDQGRLMAAVRLVSGTTGLIAPLAFPTVFARVIEVDAALAGLPFVAAAVLTGTAGAIAWTFWVKKPNSEIPDT